MGILFTLFYQPVANLLFYFMFVLNTASIVLGVLCLVILIKVVLFNLTIKSKKTQKKLKLIQPEIKKLKDNYSDRHEQTKALLELYKKEEIAPFSAFLLLFLQIPFFLSIFFVLRDIGDGMFNSTEILYHGANLYDVYFSFDNIFFGINLLEKGGILLAFIVAFFQAALLFYLYKKDTSDEKAKKIQRFLYFGIIIISFFTPFFFPAIIAIYWVINTLVTFLAEIISFKIVR